MERPDPKIQNKKLIFILIFFQIKRIFSREQLRTILYKLLQRKATAIL
jgi:hypothetical protein